MPEEILTITVASRFPWLLPLNRIMRPKVIPWS